MRKVDYRDIVGGGFLIAIGAFATIHAVNTLDLGTVFQMGPGMLPAALGCMLAAGGLMILVPALFRAGHMPTVDVRATVMVLISILVFAAMIDSFGIVPATMAAAVVVTRADSRLSAAATAVLAAGLAGGAVLIFQVGLDMPIKIFAWPW